MTQQLTRDRVEDFLYREAQYADEHRFDEWLALWVPEGMTYWIPAGRDDIDPRRQVSITYDDTRQIVCFAADLLGAERGYLDQAIWHYMSRGAGSLHDTRVGCVLGVPRAGGGGRDPSFVGGRGVLPAVAGS